MLTKEVTTFCNTNTKKEDDTAVLLFLALVVKKREFSISAV